MGPLQIPGLWCRAAGLELCREPGNLFSEAVMDTPRWCWVLSPPADAGRHASTRDGPSHEASNGAAPPSCGSLGRSVGGKEDRKRRRRRAGDPAHLGLVAPPKHPTGAAAAAATATTATTARRRRRRRRRCRGFGHGWLFGCHRHDRLRGRPGHGPVGGRHRFGRPWPAPSAARARKWASDGHLLPPRQTAAKFEGEFRGTLAAQHGSSIWITEADIK